MDADKEKHMCETAHDLLKRLEGMHVHDCLDCLLMTYMHVLRLHPQFDAQLPRVLNSIEAEFIDIVRSRASGPSATSLH